MWPQHVFRRIAEELPVFLGVVGQFQSNYFLRVGNLRRQQIAVLEPDVRWQALQMYVDPAILVGLAEGPFEPWIVARLLRQERNSSPGQENNGPNGLPSHSDSKSVRLCPV